MSRIVYASTVIVFWFLPLSASAHGWGRMSMSNYCYYPAPVCWELCPIYVPVCPPGQALTAPAAPVAVPQGPLAPPTAAPPSAGPLTPGKSQPGVSESRSYYESFSVRSPTADKPTTDKPAADRCAVGFWNLSGRDVTISVEGQAHPVPRGKSLKLQVGRQFVWRVEGHEPQSEIVPKENSGVEIVLRRP